MQAGRQPLLTGIGIGIGLLGGGKRYVNLYSEPWRVTNFSGRMGNCEKWARISHRIGGQNDLKFRVRRMEWAVLKIGLILNIVILCSSGTYVADTF